MKRPIISRCGFQVFQPERAAKVLARKDTFPLSCPIIGFLLGPVLVIKCQ